MYQDYLDLPKATDEVYESNKSVIFSKINGIYIEKFRSLSDRYLPLGDNITLISGKNGTMKSTLLGLIAHPFSSPNDARDIYGNDLKTKYSDVFRLSREKDNEEYWYHLHYDDINQESFIEPIRVYPRFGTNSTGHRVVVGETNAKNLGNFLLNTSYLNFKRLYPIIDTDAAPRNNSDDKNHKRFINDFFKKVLVTDSFSNSEFVSDKSLKATTAPKGTYYDYNSISSGEDNLGHIVNKLYAFKINKSGHKGLQGILCIDEIEAGLHPIAQVKFFDYLLKWSKSEAVQIVATTHSLYLIQHALTKISQDTLRNEIVVNMISTQSAANRNFNFISNPKYSFAYKELTFKDFVENKQLFKPIVIFEDKFAKTYFERIIKKRDILDLLDLTSGISIDETNSGNSYKGIFSLIKNGKKLFSDAIFILDPEVNITEFENTQGLHVMKLPGDIDYPIEKLMVKFILNLEGDDPFFHVMRKEKNSFESDFSDFGIFTNNEDDFKSIKTKKFKNWTNSICIQTFNKYITYYVNRNLNTKVFKDFKESFLSHLNEIYSNNSMPTIEGTTLK